MAKATKETESTSTELVPPTPVDLATVFDPNSMEAVLAEYGITAGDFYIPAAPTVQTSGFEQLCEDESPVKDAHGNLLKTNGHTPPLMYLGTIAEQDSDDFKGYDGYYQISVWHPTRGKMLISISRPAGEEEPSIIRFLRTLRKGAAFQVAEFPTRKGFKVFNPIPVQD